MPKTKEKLTGRTNGVHAVKELLKVDFGAGQNPAPGHISVDIWAGADVVHDLTVAPYPFEDESVGEAFSSHFLEHLDGPQRITFMEELYRILVPGGTLTIIVPYYASMRAVQDPTHKWPPIAESSFLYFNKQWRIDNRLDHYPITCDFDFQYGYSVAQDWLSFHEERRAYGIRHHLNVVNDLHVTLTKRG